MGKRVHSETISAKAKSLKYPEKLLVPIALDDPKRATAPVGNVLSGSLTDAEWIKRETLKKLGILVAHYAEKFELANDDDIFISALVALAKDWVPGFNVVETTPRGRGTPKIDSDDDLIRFADEIDNYVAMGATNNKDACRKFLDAHKAEKRWKSRRTGSNSPHLNIRTVEGIYRQGCAARKHKHSVAFLIKELLKQPHSTRFRSVMPPGSPGLGLGFASESNEAPQNVGSLPKNGLFNLGGNWLNGPPTENKK